MPLIVRCDNVPDVFLFFFVSREKGLHFIDTVM